MVGAGAINRADDAIPTKDELLASPEKARGFPRPLLAVLLGHAKMWAFEMALETDFPDSAAGETFLVAYFPEALRPFEAHFKAHTLRREIVATGGVNFLINNAGVTFLSRVTAASKTGVGEVMKAYIQADAQAKARELRRAVFQSALPAREAQGILLELEDALEAMTMALLSGEKGSVPKTLSQLRSRLKA
jgi:glutamate dehydrogenase